MLVSVAGDGRGTLPLAALLSLAELACSADAGCFFVTPADPLVRASPLVLVAFLLGLFAFGMMIFSRNSRGWMLSAHRQREDHSDLHRWHKQLDYFTKPSGSETVLAEKSASGK